MASIAIFEDRTMSVGRVFERAFSTIRRDPLMTVGMAALFGAAPAVAVQYLFMQIPSYALVMTVAGYALPGAIALALARWFVSLVTGTIVQGAMTRPVVAQSEGRKASVGESLAAAGSALLPLFLLGVLTGIAVIIGTTLVIVPGMVIYLFWSVAAPALAEEREGVFLALNRSQELTEGARWKIVAVLLVLLAMSMTLAIASGFASLLMFRMSFSENFTLWRLAMDGVVSLLVNLAYGTVQASLYVELRDWKEGASVESLGQVFA
jgi:hypothetical protein